MKQNGAVNWPEPALSFFIFRFENLISGPKCYRDFRETGPRTGNWISSRNRIYHLYKSLPFTEKRPRMPETGIKDGFSEMKKKKNIRTTFSDVPLLPEIFCWNDPKSLVPFTLQPDFPETFVNGKQSQKEQDEKCPLSKHQLFGANW